MRAFPESILHPVDIVYGVYELSAMLHGDDRWWIQRLVESETGWMVHNDIYLDLPTQRYITVDVELSDDWAWLYLHLRDDLGHLLSAEVEEGQLIVERNGATERFAFDQNSELGFISPFMTTITLRRKPLAIGERYDCTVVEFDGQDFAPRCRALSFERGEDIEITLDGQRHTLQQIQRIDRASGMATTWLARADGLVVRAGDLAMLSLDVEASRGRGRMPRMGKGGREM